MTERTRRPARKDAPLRSLVLGSSLLVGIVSAEVITGHDPRTGLSSWTWEHKGISIQLVQRLPDQTRAFGERAVEYDLGDWSVRYRAEHLPLRTREIWDREWQAQGVDEEARIAFRWSLLPSVQRFESGDYNWGMTSFGLSPGERFDLSLTLSVGGVPSGCAAAPASAAKRRSEPAAGSRDFARVGLRRER